MKIGVINFHFSHNYGAVLESKALQKVLAKMGHTVKVIDYRPDYLEQQHVVYPNPIKYAKWAASDFSESKAVYRYYRMVRRMLQAIVKYKDISVRKKRKEAFEPFINKMDATISYKTIDNLRNNSPKFDAYICGSDQIWNPYVTCGSLDQAYFLQFGDEQIKRISYAASPCQLNVEKYADELKSYLSAFTAISIREAEKQAALQALTHLPVEVCIDPTLLLDAADYEEFEETLSQLPDAYILMYGFEDRQAHALFGNVCAYAEKKTGMKIVDISLDSIQGSRNKIRIPAVTPGEFLRYIKNANYVVTNSFHGTVFSLIYRKEFVCISKKATSSRMCELLQNLGLQERVIYDYSEDQIERLLSQPIDYEGPYTCLCNMRKKAMIFLEGALHKD